MTNKLPKTFQMRFDLSNEQDVKIAQFLQDYPWSKTQKVKEILLMYIEGQLVPERQNRADVVENLGESPHRYALHRTGE
ncbi:MAG: hypothetical protein FJ014_17605 [Chloroflexi bacterium]|nr:hypothetical protein [Chloroflexota bacterium]